VQTVAVATFASVLVTLHQQPQYRGTASVLLSGGGTGTSGGDSGAAADRQARTAADLAAMPIVARAAIRRVPGADTTVHRFLERARAAARPDADFVDFSVVDASPDRAAALATAYARSFIKVQDELRTRAAAASEARLRKGASSRGADETAAVQDLVRGAEGPAPVLVRSGDPAHRVEPRPIRNVSFGVVAGLLVGMGLVYLWEMLNTRVREVDEAARSLRRPLLGVARIGRNRGSGGLVLLTEPRAASAESFRIVRANFDFANVDHGAQVVLFTGAVDGEGRSTTVANLALAHALAGSDVILADLHLRHPGLHELFGLQGFTGLTDVAVGHVPLDAALAPISLRQGGVEVGGTQPSGSLRVLPSGPTPLDSGEFVATRAVRTLIEQLREHAGLVFIDAPPLLPVGDALTLSSVADALIVVVNLDLATRPMLKELARILDVCPTPTLGFIATGSKPESPGEYGYYADRPAPRLATERRVA
jgi:Mrp family chromosome partitioning ATPase/capsular polysaccharide biosynthesis protein